MIYSLYIYKTKTQNLLYEKNFQIIKEERMEMFGSFFKALKSFISEIVTSGELKNVELGGYDVLISYIPEAKIDLVIIADKEDRSVISKLTPQIIQIVSEYKELFTNFDLNTEKLKNFDDKLTEFIISQKKIVDSTLLENQSEILKSIWDQKGELSTQLREDLAKKREQLLDKHSEEFNFLKKLKIVEKLIDISEKLRDDKMFIEYEKEEKSLKDEIKDRKIKLNYYLTKTKDSIQNSLENLRGKPPHEGDFKEAYINLYSFSSKLKNFANSQTCEYYYKLSKKLIDKIDISADEFSKIRSEILGLDDNIENYFDLE